MTFAAYIPFVTPINALHEWWYLLLVPLAFGISVIYRGVRLRSLDHFWKRVTFTTVQIVLAMVGLAIGLNILVQVVIPLLPVG